MTELATNNEIQLYAGFMDDASNRYFKKVIDIVKLKGIDIPQSFRELYTTISSGREQEIYRFHQRVKELMQQSTGTDIVVNFQRIMRNVPDGSGVYNMGAVLYDALIMSLYTSYHRDGSIEKGDKILWQKQYSDIFGRLSQLILKMMNGNPYERIGAVEAFAEYDLIRREVYQRYPQDVLLIDRSFYPMRDEIRNAGTFKWGESRFTRGISGATRGTIGFTGKAARGTVGLAGKALRGTADLTGKVARGTWLGITIPIRMIWKFKGLIFKTLLWYYLLKTFTPLRDAPGFMTMARNMPEKAGVLLHYLAKNSKNIGKVIVDLKGKSFEQLVKLHKKIDSTGEMSSNMIKRALPGIFGKTNHEPAKTDEPVNSDQQVQLVDIVIPLIRRNNEDEIAKTVMEDNAIIKAADLASQSWNQSHRSVIKPISDEVDKEGESVKKLDAIKHVPGAPPLSKEIQLTPVQQRLRDEAMKQHAMNERKKKTGLNSGQEWLRDIAINQHTKKTQPRPQTSQNSQRRLLNANRKLESTETLPKPYQTFYSAGLGLGV